MSTSLVCHTLSLKGYTVTRTEYVGNLVRFHLEAQRSQLAKNTGQRVEGDALHIAANGVARAVLNPHPSSLFPVFLRLPAANRPEVRRPRLLLHPRAGPRRRPNGTPHAHGQDRVVAWPKLGHGRRILKSHLRRRFVRPDLRNLRRIAIDEISVRKGQRYLTLVMNLGSGEVVFVGEGKGESALEPFWEMLEPRRRRRVEAVGVDLSPACTKAVSESLPKAKIVATISTW